MTLWKDPRLVGAAVLIGVGIAGAFYLNRPESSASAQSTDDAYVQADFTTIAPEVSGTIAKVLIGDHQWVTQGELLATIDDRSFRIAVDAARSQVARARASVAGLEARLSQQDALIRQAQATIGADEAAITLARANETRYRDLAAKRAGSVQELQQAEAQLQIQLAARTKNRAALQAARQQVAIQDADLEQARAVLGQAQAALAAAELDLSRTRITAPIRGTIGQKAVRVGAFVNAGKPLLVIVPLDAVYVTANFRETQLARVKAGQRVDIAVDALPGGMLEGIVESLGPASGVSFSPIAPHNATGNFTKIVQRLPVRIRINPGQSAVDGLRVGMSVVPTIHVDG